MTAPTIVTVRPDHTTDSIQKLAQFVGISRSSAGAERICLYKVVIPPGGRAAPHSHAGHETAIYLLKGRVETRFGEGLAQSIVNEAGDFLYIPPDLPHMPINLSDTEWAEAIVARTDAEEQESVVPYEMADAL
jgi:uncharacterized RmlC-like cupin family protein